MTESLIQLPQKPDITTMELIIRAKLLLEHSLSHSNESSSIDRMITVHGLDNTVEYLLRIIGYHVDFEAVTGKSLDTPELTAIAGELNRFFKDNYGFKLPYLSEIKLLRQVRNLVQHGVVDPAPDLPRFTVIVERFFRKVLELIFGISEEEIRISSIVKKDEVKSFVLAAEEHIDKEEYLKAIIACRDAYQNALYYKCLYSNIRIGSVPFLAELQIDRKKSYWFFDSLFQQIEISRWGIDLIKHERFLEILDHIPLEKRVDKRGGGRVLQRPWRYEDAAYCYQFVSDFILRLQQKELHPLGDYKWEDRDKYKFVERINGIDITGTFEGGCEYLYNLGDNLKLLYVSREIKKQLETLSNKDEYEYLIESYKNDLLEHRNISKVKLINYSYEIATENPERWRIIIWTKEIPFSLNKEEYKNGKKVKENININEANVEELTSVYSVTKEIAEQIVNYRITNGPITTIEQLKSINGITEQQIEWLAYTTKA